MVLFINEPSKSNDFSIQFTHSNIVKDDYDGHTSGGDNLRDCWSIERILKEERGRQ
jgi:hypothetical protein